MAWLGMLFCIAFRFELMYGMAAVMAVLHDMIIAIGIFMLTHQKGRRQ